MEFIPMASVLGLQCSTICAMKTHTLGEVNLLSLSPESMKGMKHICVDFIQGCCTESLVSQVQGATTHPPHP